MGVSNFTTEPEMENLMEDDSASDKINLLQGNEDKMHIYNRWLPAVVVEEVKEEPLRFHKLVTLLSEEISCLDSAGARLATTKWIPAINTFIKAKTTLENRDLEAVTRLGIKLLLETPDNLFIQHRWAGCVSRILQKYRKLDLKINWMPFYTLLLTVHFKRRYSYEGLGLKMHHLDSITTLVRCCRRYFQPDSAIEIWSEFRPALDDVVHNSSLEAMGFITLFMPPTVMEAVEHGLNKSPSTSQLSVLESTVGFSYCTLHQALKKLF